MLIFIYNIVAIIFAWYLSASGYVTETQGLYVVLALGATAMTMWLNYLTRKYIKDTKHVNFVALKEIFINQNSLRMSNYIGSYAIHMWIVITIVGSQLTAVLLTVVLMFRIYSMSKNRKLVLSAKEQP